jgi:hypothetical protein
MNSEHTQNQRRSILTIVLSALVLLLAPISHGSEAVLADKTIQHMIAHVARSDVVFVRNSQKYSGKEAAEHMQKKYAHFKDKIRTPEDFIELCASRSLLSGKPYLVINEKGEAIGSKEWLTAELERYKRESELRSIR